MALPTQMIGGLASGMDTNNIISSLVDIQKTSLKRLETKKEKEELYLQAYYSVNSLLKEFLTATESLAKESLWKTKGSTSSNESILTTTVTENALPGSYSFMVGQLATSSKYMSSGFSSMDSAVLLGGATGNTVSQKANFYTLLSSLNNGAGVDKSDLAIGFTDANGNYVQDDQGNPIGINLTQAALNACNTVGDLLTLISTAAQQAGLVVQAVDNGDGSFSISYSPTVTANCDLSASYATNKWSPGSGLTTGNTIEIKDTLTINSRLNGDYVGSYDYTWQGFYEDVKQKAGGWFDVNGNALDFDSAGGLAEDSYFINGAYTARSAITSEANSAGYTYHANNWSGIVDGSKITSTNLVEADGATPLELTFDALANAWKDSGNNSISTFEFNAGIGNTITASFANGAWSYKDASGANATSFLVDNGGTSTTVNFTAAHWENSFGATVTDFSFVDSNSATIAFIGKGTTATQIQGMSLERSTTGSWVDKNGNPASLTGILTIQQIDAIDALGEVVNSGAVALVDLVSALNPTKSRQDQYNDFSALLSGKLSHSEIDTLAAMYDDILNDSGNTAFTSALAGVQNGATAKDVRDVFKRSAMQASATDLSNIGSNDFYFYDDKGKIIRAQFGGTGWSFTDTGGNNANFTYNGEDYKFAADSVGLEFRNGYYQKETVVVNPQFKIEVDGDGTCSWENIAANGSKIGQQQTATDITGGYIYDNSGNPATISGFRFTGATAVSLGLDSVTISSDANSATKNAVNSLYQFVTQLDATKKSALLSALGSMSGAAASGAADAQTFIDALDAAGYTDAAYGRQRQALLNAFGAMSDADRQDVIAAFQVSDLTRAKTAFLNHSVDPSFSGFKAEWNPGMAQVQQKGEDGYLTIENAGGQAVRNVLVSDLNGGAGIYHGSIEVINKEGARTVVDLSTAATLNDVLDRINAAQGIGVYATLNDNGDGIKLTDLTGGAGTLKVYNSGLGTTATDLGLTTLDANGNGTNINKLNEKTQLSMLRNGMGINDGQLGNMLVYCDGKEYSVDAAKCQTIGDLMWAFQNARNSDNERLADKMGIALQDNRLVLTSVYKVAVISDLSEDENNTTAEDLGLLTGNTAYQRVEGLALTSQLNSVSLYNVTGKRSFDGATALSMFGVQNGETLSITDRDGNTSTFTATATSTIKDILDFFNDSSNGASLAMYIEPSSGTIAIGDLTASTNNYITVSGSAADKLGFDATHNTSPTGATGLRSGQIYFAGISGMADSFTRDANGSLTANLGSIKLTVGATDYTLDLSDIKNDSSVSDLLKKLNTEAAAKIGAGKVTFQLNKAKTGIEVVNNSGNSVAFKNDSNSTARDLGLDTINIASGTSANAGNLDTKWLGRTYSLEKLTGQSTANGSISIINTRGGITAIDLTGAKTVGEVLDLINESGAGVFASINDAGDGILLSDTYGGQGSISVSEVSGGTLAKQLGLLGSSGGGSHNGSFERTIKVSQTDSLRDIMNKISESGLDLSASIINDGTGASPYRLTISSRNSGYGSEFIVDTNVDSLDMRQTSRGQDAVILYGESMGSPTMLLSSTNSNSTAILGMTINVNKVSNEWTTVTVKQEKEQTIEAVQKLVDSYNAILTMVNQYNQYDQEKKTKGIFFGDTNIRRLTNEMQSLFFTVTENKSGGMSMWYDLGVKFQDDGTLSLDKETLSNAVNNDYDAVFNLLVKSVNVANGIGGSATTNSSGLKGSISSGASVTTTGKPAAGFDRLGASNGDKSFKSFGLGNGFCAAEPFGVNYPKDDGSGSEIGSRGYMYEVLFDKTRTLDKVYIYHVDSEDYPANKYALKNFKVEYLDPNTNEWKEMRTITDNTANANYLGFAIPTAAKGVRINATETNAADGLFRLTEIECFEPQGLASSMLQQTKMMTDVIDGWFATIQQSMEDKINRIASDIEKENTRLETYESSLIKKYANMETVMSRLQAQGATIDSYINSSNSKK